MKYCSADCAEEKDDVIPAHCFGLINDDDGVTAG